jgi:hypothetical protein
MTCFLMKGCILRASCVRVAGIPPRWNRSAGATRLHGGASDRHM